MGVRAGEETEMEARVEDGTQDTRATDEEEVTALGANGKAGANGTSENGGEVATDMRALGAEEDVDDVGVIDDAEVVTAIGVLDKEGEVNDVTVIEDGEEVDDMRVGDDPVIERRVVEVDKDGMKEGEGKQAVISK